MTTFDLAMRSGSFVDSGGEWPFASRMDRCQPLLWTRSVSSLVLLFIALQGCAAGDGPSGSRGPTGTASRVENAPSAVETSVPGAIPGAVPGAGGVTVALVENERITLEALRPGLLEVGGAVALSEYVLDERLRAACRARGITIGAAEADRERRLLMSSLAPMNARDGRGESGAMLNELRRRQLLGPARFQALLERNAMLRALVQPEVEVSEELVRQTHDLLYGEMRTARLIMVETLAEADHLSRETRRGSDFALLAMQHSQDVSAERGGLLSPISRADASYPRALRDALWSLERDEVSNPVLLDTGFAVLQLVSVTPASGPSLETVRTEVTALARQNQERLLMEQLAGSLVRRVNVTIFDDSLDWAWRQER